MEASPTEKPVVYIFHGNDEYEIAKAVEKMYERMGDPGMAELNTTRLDGRQSNEEQLRTAATAIPFLAERRLVILSHAIAKLNGAGAQARYEKFFNSLPEIDRAGAGDRGRGGAQRVEVAARHALAA